MPFKSYIESEDIPTDGIRDFGSLFPLIRYGNIKHEEKQEVVVIKESILLRNETGNKVGVLTRSSRDHSRIVENETHVALL